jgi:hypothetical protein
MTGVTLSLHPGPGGGGKAAKAMARPGPHAALALEGQRAADLQPSGMAAMPGEAAGTFGTALAALSGAIAPQAKLGLQHGHAADDIRPDAPPQAEALGDAMQGAAAPLMGVPLWSTPPPAVEQPGIDRLPVPQTPSLADREAATPEPVGEKPRAREGAGKAATTDAPPQAKAHAAAAPVVAQAPSSVGLASHNLPELLPPAVSSAAGHDGAPAAPVPVLPQAYAVAEARHSADGRVTRLSLALRPEGLGDVTVTLRNAGGRLELDIRAERADIADGLNADPAALLDAIADFLPSARSLDVRVGTTDGGAASHLPQRADGGAMDAQHRQNGRGSRDSGPSAARDGHDARPQKGAQVAENATHARVTL